MSKMSGLMLLTSNHASHDDRWIFNCGRQAVVFCVACALEQLEDPEKPCVKKKFLLTEMLKVVVDDEQRLLQCLSDELQVSVHLVTVLIGLFNASDNGIIASAIEVIVQVCCQLKNEDLVCGLVNQVTTQCLQDSSYQHSLPSLTLIGRLLQSIPPLTDLLELSYRLQYPDENIQSAITYILLYLAGGHTTSICKEPLVKELVGNLLTMISSARSPELTMNSLGLLKKVVENARSVHEVMAADNHTLVSSAFKKVLLSRNDIHQITVVQCLSQLVLLEQSLNQSTFTESLLSADIAEFLFECLATTNDILLSSIFCCLLVFTDSHDFFQECHAVYGMDSVVRAASHAIQLKNKDVLCQGLDLIKKMLKRQPTNVSLITSSSLLKSLSSLLCRCLRHSQISIVCCAGGVLQELLRKDHLKSPVDFCALEQPLKAIMDTWKDLGALSGLPQSKTSRSSTTSLASEGKHNRRYDESRKCLAVGLAVINSAFRLCIECEQDPTASASLFKAPHSQLATDEETIDVHQFVQFLLKMLDTICIPHVMVNYKHLDDADVCKCFFRILCHVYDLSTPDVKSFSSKLASSSFIQLSLGMKSRFSNQQASCDVREQVDSFLLKLSDNLLTDDDKTGLAKMQSVPDDVKTAGLDKMHSALKHINCPASDICGVLRGQSPMVCLQSSVSIVDLHSACLALMYLAAVYGDLLLNDNELFESLYFYVSSPNCCVCDMDQSSLKHFMYLYAVCYNSATLGEQTPSSLIQVLEKTDASGIYTDHASLIQWAYSARDVPQNIRRGFLMQWLLHLPSVSENNGTDEDSCKGVDRRSGRRDAGSSGDTDEGDKMADEHVDTIGLFTRAMPRLDDPVSRSQLVEDILDVILYGDETVMSRCLLLIKASIASTKNDPTSDTNDQTENDPTSDTNSQTKNDPTSDTICLLQERLPQVLLEMFLKDPIQPITEMEISTILKLLMDINLRALDCTYPVDLKLIYHVTNLLTKSISSVKTQSVIINFLHCLLYATVSKQDTSVLSVLLSNKTLLQLLEDLLTDKNDNVEGERLRCSTFSLVATMLQYQHQMKASMQMRVDIKCLIDLLSTNKLMYQRYTALNLWIAIFNTNVATDNLIQLSEGGRQQELLQDRDVNVDVKTDHLRLIIIHLQNLIMMESGSESLTAVMCYTSLLEYVRSRDQEQAEMLARQPWNGALVRLLLQVQSTSFISNTLIQLYNMLMCNESMIALLLDGFIGVITSLKTWSHITTNSYHMLLHILNKICCYLSLDQKHCIQNTLEESKEHLDQIRADAPTAKLVVINDIVLQSKQTTLPPGALLSTLELVTKNLAS